MRPTLESIHRPRHAAYFLALVALLFALAAGLATGGPTARAQTASFGPGDTLVINTDRLNMRASPSLSGAVVYVLVPANAVSVLDGPVPADGYTWFKVQLLACRGCGGPTIGWAAGEYLAYYPYSSNTWDGGFGPGDTAVVDTASLNCRSGPGLSKGVVAVLAGGETVQVLAGPAGTGDGYHWFKVTTAASTNCWVIGEGLAPTTSGGNNGGGNTGGGGSGGTWSGGFAVGDTTVVDTGSLNCRSGPGLSNGVVAILPGEQMLSVLDGPQASDGYHWFQVSTASGTTCWVIGEGLRPSTSGGGGSFAAGDQVVVNTDFLNLRSGASTGAAVLQTLPTGTLL